MLFYDQESLLRKFLSQINNGRKENFRFETSKFRLHLLSDAAFLFVLR